MPVDPPKKPPAPPPSTQGPPPRVEYVIPPELAKEKLYRPRNAFTYERKMQYLYQLRLHGRQYVAAELVGVNPGTVRNARKSDPEFNEACDFASKCYEDEVLIAEAQRRAVEGVERPIIGGKFRDEIVATERVYSDGLLKLLICAKRPEYRENGGSDANKYDMGQGGVLAIPTGPKTAEEWEEQMGAGASTAGAEPSVDAPSATSGTTEKV